VEFSYNHFYDIKLSRRYNAQWAGGVLDAQAAAVCIDSYGSQQTASRQLRFRRLTVNVLCLFAARGKFTYLLQSQIAANITRTTFASHALTISLDSSMPANKIQANIYHLQGFTYYWPGVPSYT